MQLDWTTFFWTGPHTGPLLSGQDHTMDCPIFQISWGGEKQGLKNGPVRSILVDQFETGPDQGLDHFFLDWTTHWTAFIWTGPHNGLPNTQISWGVKNKGLKMDRSGPFLWTNLKQDRTTDWTSFFWTRTHNGLPNISNFLGGSKTRA